MSEDEFEELLAALGDEGKAALVRAIHDALIRCWIDGEVAAFANRLHEPPIEIPDDHVALYGLEGELVRTFAIPEDRRPLTLRLPVMRKPTTILAEMCETPYAEVCEVHEYDRIGEATYQRRRS